MEKTLEKTQVGLFLAKYQIGGEAPGAVTLNLSLAVNTPQESVHGRSEITQAVNPPVDVKSQVNGDYSYMCVMPDNCHILVVATGYPEVKWPPHGGVGPVLLPNLHLRMVLSEDWETGTANYSFQDASGKWIDVKQAPVRIIK
jgi:hypothetical protein